MIIRTTAFIFALFSWASLHAEDLAPEKIEYIPKNLDDAVRVLKRDLSPEDKVLAQEQKASLHFDLGMGLRNGWGLWGDSRLAVYFRNNGITHADSMSSYITAALIRDLKGESYDLLEMITEGDQDYPHYQYPIFHGRVIDPDFRQAILYQRKEYGEDGYVVSTKLLWHPGDEQIYLKEGDEKPQVATKEEIDRFKLDRKHWLFSLADLEMLHDQKLMSEEKRLTVIKDLIPIRRMKFDGIFPRTQDPTGLDAKNEYDRFGAFAESEASKLNSQEVLMEHVRPTIEFSETPFISALDFLRILATESLHQRTYFRNHFVAFELNYDPNKVRADTLITGQWSSVSLDRLFSDVLEQVDLTYEVKSDFLIIISPKKQERKGGDPFG